jgi:hypothetical protein
MKKLILLAIASFSAAGVASATSITEQCGAPVSFGNLGTAITGAQGPASFSCAALPVGAGQTITEVELFYAADYSFGSADGTNTVVWTFNTASGTWSGGNTETVSGGFSSTTFTPPTAAGALNAPFNLNVVGPGQIDTTSLGVGTNTFAGVNISAPVSITGGVISTTGDVFAQVTYSSAAPEPATLGLTGMALLGVGFLARRKGKARV